MNCSFLELTCPVPYHGMTFRRIYELYKGRHLLIDCQGVPRDVCLNDQLILESMAKAATRAGATVISQVRYHFGHNSPPGFTAMVLLDESHCSAHCYADLGLMALDIFTCGRTNPSDILKYILEDVDLGQVTTVQMPRFTVPVTPVTSTSSPHLDAPLSGIADHGGSLELIEE
ncbi:adenosylmethionine decarboxylase [Symmachiella dynata]|uniref:adenosylmethionine decarboxylase n=1 Tax=Symmachiella dynata TaxID=2527995 RepID=UPI0030EED702